jgi:hypothetical protein
MSGLIEAGDVTGWPNVFPALPVAKDVFEKRPNDAPGAH